jgi:hypothetical protein
MDELAIILYGIIAFFIGFLNARCLYAWRTPEVYRDDDTKGKVIGALLASGLDAKQTYVCMAYMKNRGILFYEPSKPKNVVEADVQRTKYLDSSITKGSIG